MPIFTLFHLMPPASGYISGPQGDAYLQVTLGMAPTDIRPYRPVARIEAEDCEALFALTQSIDAAWTSVHPPLCAPDLRLRSTSVGDVILEDGKALALFCATTGWCPLPAHISLQLRARATSVFP